MSDSSGATSASRADSPSDADRQKASGININLWLGLGMLALGLLFLLWRQVNPLRIEPKPVQQPTAEPKRRDRS